MNLHGQMRRSAIEVLDVYAGRLDGDCLKQNGVYNARAKAGTNVMMKVHRAASRLMYAHRGAGVKCARFHDFAQSQGHGAEFNIAPAKPTRHTLQNRLQYCDTQHIQFVRPLSPAAR